MVGAERIELDEQGLCQFQHQSGFTVTLIWQGDAVNAFTLSSDVLQVPSPDQRASLYSRLLRLNFLLIETAGSTLAVDEDERYVFLCRELSLNGLDEMQFLERVAGFMIQAAEIRAELGGGDALGSDGDTARPPDSGGGFNRFSNNVIRS